MKKHIYYAQLLAVALLFSMGTPRAVLSQPSYNFTAAGAVGHLGPTQEMIDAAYAATNLDGQVTSNNGIQLWEVPATGLYQIEAWGGQGFGTYGGRGAYISGEFNLQAGDVLKILVGQRGGPYKDYPSTTYNHQYGGGGGSFVTTLDNTPYVVAGGGGGSHGTEFRASCDGQAGNDGASGSFASLISAGGTNGLGGQQATSADGGAGLLGNGGGQAGGFAFINGGAGNNGGSCCPSGGGGGSYNAGVNQANLAGVNLGDGKVIITLLSGIEAVCNTITVYLDATGMAVVDAADLDGGSTGSGMLSFSVNGQPDITFDCTHLGTTQMATLTVSDGNVSANCEATITVLDEAQPVAICKNTTVYLDANGQYTLQEADVLDFANSSDNCSFSVSLISPSVVDCADFGATVPVMVSIADPSGNTASCLADVYVDKSYGLPAPWAGTDIGYAGAGNSYAYDHCLATPTFTITANANNSTLPTDNLGLISQSLCGDFQITARIQSLTPTGFAGLTARESSAPGSRMAGVYTNLNNMVRWEARTVANGNKLVNFFPRPLPYWLRLQRQGNWFLSYSSYDGLNFTLVTAQQVPVGSCLEVGLGAFTNITGMPATAVFSDVSVSGGVLPLVQLPDANEVGMGAVERNITLYPNPARDVVSLTRTRTSNPGQPGQALPVGEALISYSNQKIGGTGAPVGEGLISYSNQKIGGTGAPAGRLEVRGRLLNDLGQVLETRQWAEGELRLEWPVQGLAPGLYLIEVTEEGQAPQVLKFVKQE